MKPNPKIELHPTPKQSIQVNKPVVMTIAAVVVFVFLWAIINAFTTSSAKKTSTTQINAPAEKAIHPSAAIKDVPENYRDMNAVAKYSGLQRPDMNNVEKELASLKAEHEALEQQLLALSQAKPVEKPPANLDNPQARSSSLFFGGISDQGMFGGGAAAGGMIQNAPAPAGGAATQQPTPPVTPQQAAYFSQQSQNIQKLAVAKATDNPEDIYDLHNLVTPVSPYEIQAGTVIPATLITGINTSLAGTVVAQIRQNVYDSVSGKYLLIPKGSKLLGEYDSRVATGQRRVLISFNRVIRPDGTSILLGKPNNADLLGATGNEGNVNEHWGRILSAATISTILSVGAGLASDRYSQPNNYYPNTRQSALAGASQGVSNVGQQLTSRAMDIQPTITLPAGYEFNVIVKKDMVLTPYKTN